jgi:ribose transport system permease protein
MRKTAVNFLKSKTAVMLYVTIVVAVFFGIWNDGFLGLANLKSLMTNMSTTGILCVGITLLLISGEIDLATGAEAAMGGIFVVLLIQAGIPWPIALLLTVIGGILMGCILALLVNKIGLMAFISSISMISVYNGLARILTNSQNIAIDQKYGAYYTLGAGVLFNALPIPFVIMIVLMVVYGFILYATNFGRSIYMCGGNRMAARLCGINRKKITTVLFLNNSAIAALTGALVAARMHNASPIAIQSGATDAITAAVLGGVSFAGGVGNLGGCFIGVTLITFFNSGLTASGLQAYWQIVVQGLLLLVALTVDFFNERSVRKRSRQRSEPGRNEPPLCK